MANQLLQRLHRPGTHDLPASPIRRQASQRETRFRLREPSSRSTVV